MDKEVKCPWCSEMTTPKLNRSKNDSGHIIVERECSHCGKILAAYLEEEGNFLPDVRTFVVS